MAFDGVMVSAIASDIKSKLIGGKVNKVGSPEKDELILSFRSNRQNYKLLISIMANMPKVHFTKKNKVNPLVAQGFLMLLRKHLVGAELEEILQPDFERILIFKFRGTNELGDLQTVNLIVEMMGRHSNIIFTDKEGIIIDSMKRIGANVSSVREVFPKRMYVSPPNQGKINPLRIQEEDFYGLANETITATNFLIGNFTGISNDFATEISNNAGIDVLEKNDMSSVHKLYVSFADSINKVKAEEFDYNIYELGKKQVISATKLKFLEGNKKRHYGDISQMIEDYYDDRELRSRLNQKSSDLKKTINTNLERCYKKLNIQSKIIKDSEDRQKYKLYSDLIFANLYAIKKGNKKVTLNNFYDGDKEIDIQLDENLTPTENANKYLKKYNKKKRALVATTEQLRLTKNEIEYLESVKYATENAIGEEDLIDIRNELIKSGYVKKKKSKSKKALKKSTPIHYETEDGFHIYVGKNNMQNDYLVSEFGNKKDLWFHIKGATGSHVLLVDNGREIPDKIYEIAAGVAAYHSSGRNSSKVDVDYTELKNIKRPNKAMPGFVIYHTNYSMTIKPSINGLKEISD